MSEAARPGSTTLLTPLRIALLLALFVLAGAAAGVVWHALWTPPRGVALDDQFVFTSEGLPQAFDGTALYALVAVCVGLALGVAVALVAEGVELLSLAAITVGAGLAAATMSLVGAALGPPDASEEVRGLEDYTGVEDDLRVDGVGAYLALPTGALLGAGGVFLTLTGRRPEEEDEVRRLGEDPALGAREGAAEE